MCVCGGGGGGGGGGGSSPRQTDRVILLVPCNQKDTLALDK